MAKRHGVTAKQSVEGSVDVRAGSESVEPGVADVEQWYSTRLQRHSRLKGEQPPSLSAGLTMKVVRRVEQD